MAQAKLITATVGAAGALGARALLVRGLSVKLRGDLAELNAGDYRPLLAASASSGSLPPPARRRAPDGAQRTRTARLRAVSEPAALLAVTVQRTRLPSSAPVIRSVRRDEPAGRPSAVQR